MLKYLGDAIIKGNLTVQTDKPLDSRLIVQNANDLYTIDSRYAYLGMPVISIEDKTVFILIDKSKITLPSGWAKVVSNSSNPNPDNPDNPSNPDNPNNPDNPSNNMNYIVLEQDEYDNLEEKDSDVLYFILEPVDGWIFPIKLEDDGWVFPITLEDDEL